MEEILTAGLAELGVFVPEGSIALLRSYYALLDEKNKVMNLTAITGEEATARQHFLDCAAMLRYLPTAGKRVLDVGAGAGFPGLVLRCLSPDMKLTMLDSLQKRVAFQQEMEVIASYTEDSPAEFPVTLRIRENNDEIFHLKLSVPTAAMASRLCAAFRKDGLTVYADLIRQLVEDRADEPKEE